MPLENDKCISNLQTILGTEKENTSPKKKKENVMAEKDD